MAELVGTEFALPVDIQPPFVVRDTSTMIGRSLRLTRRNIDAILTGLMMPVLLMLLFVYVYGGAIHTGTSYVDYAVPGVLLLSTGFVAATTAATVNHDMTGGIIDRFRSMDVSGSAILGGHTTAGILRNFASVVLVFGVAVLMGFRSSATFIDWLGATGLLLLFIAAISWLAAMIGLITKSPEAAQGLSFVIVFLPMASSAMVPVNTMPGWLQPFASYQPVTPVIDTIRGLLVHTDTPSRPWLALTWCIVIMVTSVFLASVLFRHRAR